MLREDTLMEAIAGFFDQYVFGCDRAEHAEARARQAETPQDNDLSLLDLLPVAAGLFADAPDRIREAQVTGGSWIEAAGNRSRGRGV